MAFTKRKILADSYWRAITVITLPGFLAQGLVELLQTLLDSCVEISSRFVTDIVVSAKDISLVMKILLLRLIRQKQQQ